MSVDERILQALEIDARIPAYDEVTPVLAAVVSRTRRRRAARRSMIALAAALAAVVAAVVAPAILGRAGAERDVAGSFDRTAPSLAPAEVAFTYRSSSLGSRFGIQMPLRLTLRADGTGSLRGPTVPASSFTYRVTGFSIAIGLWADSRCAGVPYGQYTFGRMQDRRVRFSLIHDPCVPRRWALLGGPGAHPWSRVP